MNALILEKNTTYSFPPAQTAVHNTNNAVQELTEYQQFLYSIINIIH